MLVGIAGNGPTDTVMRAKGAVRSIDQSSMDDRKGLLTSRRLILSQTVIIELTTTVCSLMVVDGSSITKPSMIEGQNKVKIYYLMDTTDQFVSRCVMVQ